MDVHGCEIFSASKAREREHLGEEITEWMNHGPKVEIVRTDVVQSSDKAFHCLSIVIWWRYRRT